MIKQRNTRTMILTEDALVLGIAVNENVGEPMFLRLPSSGDTSVVADGGKCAHGVYIPAFDLSTKRAQACSLCHPFVIEAKEDGKGFYKA